MAVRFKGDFILTAEGEVLDVAYEDLRQACLKDEYSTISIKEIIFHAVYEQINFFHPCFYLCFEFYLLFF